MSDGSFHGSGVADGCNSRCDAREPKMQAQGSPLKTSSRRDFFCTSSGKFRFIDMDEALYFGSVDFDSFI
jgi:hypothetical protein